MGALLATISGFSVANLRGNARRESDFGSSQILPSKERPSTKVSVDSWVVLVERL